MEQKKIDRINFLAKKSKESELTPAEKAEQNELRAEYINAYKRNLKAQLENITIIDE